VKFDAVRTNYSGRMIDDCNRAGRLEFPSTSSPARKGGGGKAEEVERGLDVARKL
jgi:hypothetical protein